MWAPFGNDIQPEMDLKIIGGKHVAVLGSYKHSMGGIKDTPRFPPSETGNHRLLSRGDPYRVRRDKLSVLHINVFAYS